MSEPVNMVKPVYRLYQWAWVGLDWLYPPQCGGCGRDGSRWCSECQNNTQILPDSVCEICGRLTDTMAVCNSCRNVKRPYSAIRSWAVFGGSIRSAIHRLKYEGDISLADILARNMLSLLQKKQWEVDVTVPVPISPSRKAERGYNQAALLALPLALGQGVPFRTQLLTKVRDTRTQVGLSVTQRRKNVAGAFSASGRFIKGKNILVVDDVLTSGATMGACAQALVDAGAKQVYGLTLAQAMFDPKIEGHFKDTDSLSR